MNVDAPQISPYDRIDCTNEKYSILKTSNLTVPNDRQIDNHSEGNLAAKFDTCGAQVRL